MEKTWKNESRHTTFESADQRRKTLLAQNTPGMLVKVKLMNSDNTFVVKTHNPPPERLLQRRESQRHEHRGAPFERSEKEKENPNSSANFLRLVYNRHVIKEESWLANLVNFGSSRLRS